MVLNGSDLIDNPLDTMMSPFTDIIGSAFWLIPIGFIGLALYIKTRNFTATSIWLMASCSILGTSNLFVDHPEMSFLYYVVSILGLVGTVISVYLMKK